MPAKNDDAVCLIHRINSFAGKPRSNRSVDRLWEPGLPAIGANAVCLKVGGT
ncbi:hypothetical protein ACTUVN_000853 [Pseudomonas caspiana]